MSDRTVWTDGCRYPEQGKNAISKIHKEELLADWELAIKGEEPFRIAPLQ